MQAQTTSLRSNDPEVNPDCKGIRLFGGTQEIDGVQVTEELAGAGILSMRNLFSKEDCDKVLAFYRANPQMTRNGQTVTGDNPSKKCKEIALGIPQTPDAIAIDDLIYQRLRIAFNLVNKLYPGFMLGRCADSHYLIQHYDGQENYYHWHMDDGIGRRLAVIIYLNDVAEGGETEFWYQDLRIKPEAGKILIFPTTAGYTHRGRPPVNCEKFIVTTFLVDGV